MTHCQVSGRRAGAEQRKSEATFGVLDAVKLCWFIRWGVKLNPHCSGPCVSDRKHERFSAALEPNPLCWCVDVRKCALQGCQKWSFPAVAVRDYTTHLSSVVICTFSEWFQQEIKRNACFYILENVYARTYSVCDWPIWVVFVYQHLQQHSNSPFSGSILPCLAIYKQTHTEMTSEAPL